MVAGKIGPTLKILVLSGCRQNWSYPENFGPVTITGPGMATIMDRHIKLTQSLIFFTIIEFDYSLQLMRWV